MTIKSIVAEFEREQNKQVVHNYICAVPEESLVSSQAFLTLVKKLRTEKTSVFDCIWQQAKESATAGLVFYCLVHTSSTQQAVCERKTNITFTNIDIYPKNYFRSISSILSKVQKFKFKKSVPRTRMWRWIRLRNSDVSDGARRKAN